MSLSNVLAQYLSAKCSLGMSLYFTLEFINRSIIKASAASLPSPSIYLYQGHILTKVGDTLELFLL